MTSFLKSNTFNLNNHQPTRIIYYAFFLLFSRSHELPKDDEQSIPWEEHTDLTELDGEDYLG